MAKKKKKKKETKKKKEEEEVEDEAPEGEEEEGTIGDIVEEEGLVSEPDRESMLGQEGEPELSEITMHIDRLEGKMEMFKDLMDSANQRVLDLNERLGDTRRMVFEREKSASKMSDDFQKVAGIIKELDPNRLVLKFEKFNAELSKQSAEVERLDDLIKNIGDRVKVLEDKTAQIKSMENIAKAASLVNKKLKQMDESRRYADKMASKIEAMFMEVNEKVNYLKDATEKIKMHDDMLEEALKDLDQVKFQIDEELVRKRDVNEMLDSVKDIIVEEVVGINPAAFENLRRRVAIMENREKSDKDLKGERRKYDELINQVERDFQMGRISRDAYEEIKSGTEKKVAEIEMVLESRMGGGESSKSKKKGKKKSGKKKKKKKSSSKGERMKDKLLKQGKKSRKK